MTVDDLLRHASRAVYDQCSPLTIEAWDEFLARVAAGMPVDGALGVNGQYRLQDRNSLIRQAGDLIAKDPWPSAGDLAVMLERLDTRKPWNDVSRLLKGADVFYPCPRTQRQIYSILKDD